MNFLDEINNFKKSADLSREFRKEGNRLFTKKHDDDSHIQVLSLYTKSIAFAPENSEELALGYGNRSALLHHVHKYKECIIDTDKALMISRSDKLKTKLLSRKATCFKWIAESSNDSEETEEISSKKLNLPKLIPSKKVPCVAESLSLECNEKYGRHFVANQVIEPGEIVAMEDTYISIPFLSKVYLVCSHCLAQTFNGIPCNTCAINIYCSENCKTKAWNEYHDVECLTIFNSMLLSMVPQPVEHQKSKAGVRLFIKLTKKYGLKNMIQEIRKSDFKNFDGIFSCNQFQSHYNLAADTTSQENKLYEGFVEMSIQLLSQNKQIFTDDVKSYFKSENEMFAFTEEMLRKSISIISINSFMFESLDGCNCVDHNYQTNCTTRGLALVPCGSLFNHSCVPNVYGIFGEKKKLYFSIRPIKKGEQLFICYCTSIFNLKIDRQYIFNKKYAFSCDCQACTEDWVPEALDPNVVVDKNRESILAIISEHAECCKKKGMRDISQDTYKNWDHSEQTLSQMISLIKLFYKKLPAYNAMVASTAHNLHLIDIFWKRYGLEWDKMSECSGAL